MAEVNIVYGPNGSVVEEIVYDPSLDVVLADTPTETIVQETFVNQQTREVRSTKERLVPKPGSPLANEISLDTRLDTMKAELRAAITADQALRDRAQAARQAIPNQASTTTAILRTAMLEQLAIEIDSANARIALDRAILNITRVLREDYSQAAE